MSVFGIGDVNTAIGEWSLCSGVYEVRTRVTGLSCVLMFCACFSKLRRVAPEEDITEWRDKKKQQKKKSRYRAFTVHQPFPFAMGAGFKITEDRANERALKMERPITMALAAARPDVTVCRYCIGRNPYECPNKWHTPDPRFRAQWEQQNKQRLQQQQQQHQQQIVPTATRKTNILATKDNGIATMTSPSNRSRSRKRKRLRKPTSRLASMTARGNTSVGVLDQIDDGGSGDDGSANANATTNENTNANANGRLCSRRSSRRPAKRRHTSMSSNGTPAATATTTAANNNTATTATTGHSIDYNINLDDDLESGDDTNETTTITKHRLLQTLVLAKAATTLVKLAAYRALMILKLHLEQTRNMGGDDRDPSSDDNRCNICWGSPRFRGNRNWMTAGPRGGPKYPIHVGCRWAINNMSQGIIEPRNGSLKAEWNDEKIINCCRKWRKAFKSELDRANLEWNFQYDPKGLPLLNKKKTKGSKGSKGSQKKR